MNDAPKIVFPTVPVTSPDFEYRNAAQTDVTQTWRKFGWLPKAEADQPAEEVAA